MEPEEIQQRRFTHDEVGELIETATRLDQLRSDGEGMSLDEVRRVAAELGISDEALQAALRDRAATERAEAERAEAEATALAAAEAERAEAAERRRQAFNAWKAHVASFLGVMVGLLMIDLVTDGSLDWVWWPAMGWGIGLAVHTFTWLFGVADENEG